MVHRFYADPILYISCILTTLTGGQCACSIPLICVWSDEHRPNEQNAQNVFVCLLAFDCNRKDSMSDKLKEVKKKYPSVSVRTI